MRRARRVFDEVIVAIAINSAKTTLFDTETRVSLARAAVADMEGVSVRLVPGLLVDFCHEVGANAIVKGLRGGSDVDHEVPMALMNRHVGDLETVFLLGDPALGHVASSLVKDVARFGGRIENLVPSPVAEALYAALGSAPSTEEEGTRA
jgi:pantetheine-phosphate adenylyltransferase